MRKGIAFVGLAAILAMGMSAYATDYTLTAGTGTWQYDNTLIWSPNGVPGLDNIDGAADTITFPGTKETPIVTYPAGEYYIGAVTMDNGQIVNNRYGQPFKLRVLDDAGKSGDLIISDHAYLEWANGSDWEIDGNVQVVNGGMRSWSLQSLTLTMNGAGKVLDIDQSNYLGALIIPEGASISAGDGTGATVRAVEFDLAGTFIGDLRAGGSGEDSLVRIADNATWDTGVMTMSTAQGTWTLDLDTSHLPTFDGTQPSGGNGVIRRTIRQKKDLTIAGDMTFGVFVPQWTKDIIDIWTTDNGDGDYSDLTVGGNFTFGGGNRTAVGIQYGFEANDSQITINGDALFDRRAYIVGGTSRWTFKGNVQFTDDFRYDLNGIENTTFTVAGGADQTLDFQDEMTLGSLVVDKTGGSATLTDNVLVGGDLRVLGGTLDTNGMNVVLNNATHELEDQAATSFDEIDLLAEAVVNLASDVTATTVRLGTDSELYLNGFTLTANGTTYDGSQQMTWSVDNGTIFGTLIAPGDANGDGKVDGGDLAIWQQHYDPLGLNNNTFADGDFNGDGKVDGGDLALWQQYYNPLGTAGAQGAASVPEPATLLLLGSGLLGGLGSIRRRRS